MGMTGRWVRYGTEAAEALRLEIRAAKGSEPLAPVTVVVPSNQVGVSLRRLLAGGSLGPVCGSGPGLVAVTFVTPYRLAELFGAAVLAAEGRRPVSTPVLTAAVRGALAAEPGLFEEVASHPATEAALVATYQELRDLSVSALADLSRCGRRPAEVVRLCRGARELLEPSWYDEEDLMASAAKVFEARGDLGDLGSVIVFLPQRLSRHATALLRAAAAHGPVSVVAGCTGDERADAEVLDGITRLGLAMNPFFTDLDLHPLATAAATRVVSASDSDEEVRAAIRLVVDALRTGTPLDRMAILYASSDPYGRLVREQLDAAGISFNGPSEMSVAERMAGRLLLGLLALPAGGFRRQDVFAWLTTAPVRHGEGWVPTSAWERLSREAGVVRGRHDWDGLLAGLADRNQEEAASIEADPDRSQGQAAWKRSEASRARDLRAFVVQLIDQFDGAEREGRTWSEWASWAQSLFTGLVGGPNQRASWPELERRAGERVEIALDRLRSLDTIEAQVTLEVFTRTLAIELEADVSRIGRFGEGLLVGSVGMGVGLDLDLLVVLGMAEGSFPATVHDDSLLPDIDREAASGELALRGDQVNRLHRQFLAVLAGASSQVLCLPRGDLRKSSERVPSRWLLDVASKLAGERWWSGDLAKAKEPWLNEVASFDAGIRNCAFPVTAQEQRLRHLLAVAPLRPDLEQAAAAIDLVLGNGVAVLDARASDAFTRFDGNLAGLAVASPVDSGSSATSLERWAGCPHAYFVQNVLGVEPTEQPEEFLEISALDRGSLVHEVLERFIVEVLERPAAEQPEPSQPWTDDDARRMSEIASGICDDYEARGLTGRPIFWQRDRRRVILELHKFLAFDDNARRAAGTRPLAAELAFGLPSGMGPVPFPLPDGRSVPMRGKADRVDIAVDGSLRVLDYKTGKSDSYKNLDEADPHQRGTRLQLVIYALAARRHQGRLDADVDAQYWFVSNKGGFKQLGYRVTDDVMRRVGEAMLTIVTGIERGVFAPHPKPATTSPFIDCHFCDPDGLGTAELRRHWARKLGDPDLASYVELTDPIDRDDTDLVEVEP